MAATFDYPNVLRRPTREILERFRRGGSRLVLLWWGFAMTAVFAPLAVLVAASLDGANPVLLDLSVTVGVLAAAVQFLGLIRWAFVVPYLARADVVEGTSDARKDAIDIVFQTLNRYLGVAVGEHLGDPLTGAWSVLVGVAVLQQGELHPVVGIAGIVIGAVLAVCSIEFVVGFEEHGWKLAGVVTPFAYIAWSLWLVAMGVMLLL